MAEVVEVKTIGEVERIVLASGEWAGTLPVEFSNDGESWAEVWLPTEDHPHPVFARVTVHRKDVLVPVRVTIRWEEQFPAASEEWAAKWAHSPMRHFGRTARMVAFRQAFRDLLGDLVIEDEAPGADHETPAEPAPRDWAAEIAAAATVDELDEVVRAARKQRVFTPDAAGTALDRQWKARRRDLAGATEPTPEAQPPAPAPKPAAPAKPGPPKPSAKQPERPRKRRAPRPRNSVADNLDTEVADALRVLGSKKR